MKFINCFVLNMLFAASLSVAAQTNPPEDARSIWSLDFSPKINGFQFPNYKNVGDRWKDDINADDLIRMFGVKAVCLKDDPGSRCDLKPQARTWLDKQLKAMNIGHCEGIGVASLKFNTGLPFKRRTKPEQFQPGAKTPFNLRLDQSLENYIAYYWITQTFKEISHQSKATARLGPANIAKILIDSINDKKDTYLIGIWKYEKGRSFDGHAVTPFAVEDTGRQYKILVYDNNFPGETKELLINKTGAQQWSYTAGKDRYIGDSNTESLEITATSWRDNRCFAPSFSIDYKSTGCGVETAQATKSIFMNALFQPQTQQQEEDAEFFLTGEGDMLISDGTRPIIGYDPKTKRFYKGPAGADAGLVKGGFGLDLPNFNIPYDENGPPYVVTFSGHHLDQESLLDFVFSAPGFTVGFDGILLDPGETLKAEISADGEQLTFTSSSDGETPEVFFSFGAEDEVGAGYIVYVGGVELDAGRSLTMDFEFENGKMYFSDDDGNEDEYDIDLFRIDADGTIHEFKKDNLNIGNVDRYEMDFGNWDGTGDICFKDDDDGDGFDDEDCEEEASDTPGASASKFLRLLEQNSLVR